MQSFLDWVGTTPPSQLLQTVDWIIPSLQAVHIIALALVFTSAMVLDLRVLGVAGRTQPFGDVARRFAGSIGWGLLVLLVTGVILMIGEPTRAILKLFFQLKMLAVVIVGLITWWLAVKVRRDPEGWASPERRAGAKALAVASLALWVLIIFFGRWIAYT